MHSACSVQGPKMCSIRFTKFQFGVACSKFVFTSYRGNLCLGQCTILNSCGNEYAKFNTYEDASESQAHSGPSLLSTSLCEKHHLCKHEDGAAQQQVARLHPNLHEK